MFQTLINNKLWNLSAYTKKTPNSNFLLTDLHPAIISDAKLYIDDEANSDTHNSSSEIEKSFGSIKSVTSPSSSKKNKSPSKVASPCTPIETEQTDVLMNAGTATASPITINISVLSNDGFIIPDGTVNTDATTTRPPPKNISELSNEIDEEVILYNLRSRYFANNIKGG